MTHRMIPFAGLLVALALVLTSPAACGCTAKGGALSDAFGEDFGDGVSSLSEPAVTAGDTDRNTSHSSPTFAEAGSVTSTGGDGDASMSDGRGDALATRGGSSSDARTLLGTGRQNINSCFGTRCPDVSFCVLVDGAPSCQCPDQFSRLINNVCTAAPLRRWGYLDPQNNARAAVGSVPLVWDISLAVLAQSWANQLASTSNCQLALGPRPPGVGQNVANWFNDPDRVFRNAQAMGLWVRQGSRYSYSRFSTTGAAGCSTRNWRDCAAYTQVIWNNTRLVGCGVGRCPAQSGRVWVCNYSPAGNIEDQFPYVQ